MLEDFEDKISEIIGNFFNYTYEKNRADLYLDDHGFEIEIYDLKPVQSKLQNFTQSIINEIKKINNIDYFRIDIFFKIFKEQDRKMSCAIIKKKLTQFSKNQKEINYEDEKIILNIYFKKPASEVGMQLKYLPHEKIETSNGFRIKRSGRIGVEKNFEYSFSYSGLHKIYAKNIKNKADLKQIKTNSGLLIVGLENWKPGILNDLNQEIINWNKGKKMSHLISEIFLLPYSYNENDKIKIDGLIIYKNLNPKSNQINYTLQQEIVKIFKNSFTTNQALKVLKTH